MKKIINPCQSKGYTMSGKEKMVNAFVKIEYTDSNLSISGVVGPKSNGDCYGSAGQCIDAIRNGIPTKEWSEEMLNKLCDIWEEWHLNDMRAYCKHQKDLGWKEFAKKNVTLYHYRLTKEASDKQKEAEKEAIAALRNGITFSPTEEQVKYANLPYSLISYKELNDSNYEPKKPLYSGDTGATEIKKLGWLNKEEHPDGILGKACPICGYKYGTSWVKEDVPEEIIEWLENLPDTKITPAWV